MALSATGEIVVLRVLKPATNSKFPTVYTPTNEDLNKFDFAHAKVDVQWDITGMVAIIMITDITSYYP